MKLQNVWQDKIKDKLDKAVLGLILGIFLAYSLFMAVNLQPGIIPDEPAHFIFSKHFASTLGIPDDTPETYRLGWYIERNPFLYYWLNGRIINLLTMLQPSITDRGMLVALRIVSSLYALGTLVFCYYLSGEFIRHKWWRLLPVFLLSNTLMFVFLAAGVNYDNLANLFSMAGLFYLLRVFNHKGFLNNSLAWMIFIGLGALVKFTILPLALAMAVAWLVYIILNRKKITRTNFKQPISIVLVVLFAGAALGNFAIYGLNLLEFSSLTPPCREILSKEQCVISPYVRRYEMMALEEKLTISESIQQGYPSPLTYPFDTWIPNMLYRSFGAIGHQAYYPLDLINYYQILFYWMVFLGMFDFAMVRKASFRTWGILGIVLFYALVLLIRNYSDELVYGFQHISQAGRYLFPVIGGITILFTKILEKVPIRAVQWITLAFVLGLFLFGGPYTLIRGYDTIFSGWFIN